MKTQYGTRLTQVVLRISAVAAGLVLLSACASAPQSPPTVALTEAREAIAHAEQSGGRQHAGNELDQAQRKLELAENAVDEEDMAEAERLAQEARVTADLVSARTEAAKAKEINRELERSVEALTEEMRRSGEQR